MLLLLFLLIFYFSQFCTESEHNLKICESIMHLFLKKDNILLNLLALHAGHHTC